MGFFALFGRREFMKIVALDIGGTSIKSGIWMGAGAVDVREWETNAGQGGAYVMERVKEIIRTYDDFEAIGISTAGQVNSKEGYIRYANENIPGYTGMRIRDILQATFEVPVAVENDVNAAAIGEGQFGAGVGKDDFLCVTYGTGVGGAIVLGGNIYTGSAFSAGEFGGILIHPEDVVEGKPFEGCYEKYASTTALVSRAKAYDETLIDGRIIFSRLEEPEIRLIIDGWMDEIVHGLISLIHIFNPSCIIMGGGVMAQSYVLEGIKQKVGVRMIDSFSNVEILPAKLGNHAGLLGAAYLAKKEWDHAGIV